MSVVIKRGFAALRYLNDGRLTMPEEAITIPAIIVLPKSARLLRNWALLLIFLTITHTTRNAVHPIMKIPFRLEININPPVATGNPNIFNNSNNTVTKRNTDVKITEVNMMNLLSFLRNGNARKRNPIGSMKNWMPPHEARPKARKIAPPTTFAIDTFPLSDLMPLIRR
jgi:hypothetical protein